MVNIRPFKAIRPIKNLAEKVASLPYDVLNSEEARELGDANKYSFLHIDKAEIDLDPAVSLTTQLFIKKQRIIWNNLSWMVGLVEKQTRHFIFIN